MYYDSSEGYITALVRDDYITSRIKKECDISNIDRSLVPQINANRLYFWQLFSILGKEKILQIVTTFYENVFTDSEEWFREAFEESGDIHYHIKGQSYFWYDVMGGGKYYRGGKKLVQLKHSGVSEVMNSRGGERWMWHMYNSLKTNYTLISEDPRVIPCMLDFLQYFMDEYSVAFDFNLIKMHDATSFIYLVARSKQNVSKL